MQSALAFPSSGVPRAKLIASSRQKYLAVAHNDGSISIFHNLKPQCTILSPHQSVSFLRIVRDSLLVGFCSGLFAKYCIHTGHLKVCVELDFELRDCLVIESSILLVGDEPQLVAVQRKTLEIERAIALPAVPVHVTKYEGISIIYSNGQIDLLDEESWELSRGFMLPTKQDDGGVDEPVVGASVLPNGQWVIIRRHTWTLYEREGSKLTSQFESVAVSPFNYCVPDAEGVLIVCDDEKIVLIESNNVQVIEPVWPQCTLVGVAFLQNGRCAFLHDLQFYVLDASSGQWQGPSTFTKITSESWCVSGEFMSNGKTIKRIKDEETVFNMPAAVSFLHVENDKAYAGLENGNLTIIDASQWKLETNIYLLNSAIVGIICCKDWIVAWSNDTVGTVNVKSPEKFHIIPIGREVKFAYTQDNHLRVADSLSHQEWDLDTGMTITGGQPEPQIPKSFRTWRPVASAPLDTSREDFGVVYPLGKGITIAIIPMTPTLWSAPLIYTLRAYQGASLADCVIALRETTSIGHYEDFVVHVCSIDATMGRLASSILTAMWSPNRLQELEDSAGTRALVLLNSVYPLVPVGNWLRKQINGLLDGTRNDKLLALQLLTKHPDLDLCPFPFKAIEDTKETCTAETFISTVARADMSIFNDVMAAAAQKPEAIPSVLYCISVILDYDVVKLEGDNLVMLISTISHCISAGKVARDLLATLYWRYPHHVLFNRKKQRVLTVADLPQLFGVVFDLRKATRVDLKSPEPGLTAVGFVDDGNAVEASSSSQTYYWNLSAGILSLFKRQAHEIEPEKVKTTLVTKTL